MMPSEDKQKLFERMHEQLGRRVPEIPKEFEDPQIEREYLAWRHARWEANLEKIGVYSLRKQAAMQGA